MDYDTHVWLLRSACNIDHRGIQNKLVSWIETRTRGVARNHARSNQEHGEMAHGH